jgi:predicted dehydrogenase/threonine dehydrogenase-like Zn-dependent dehydrogenase
MKQLLQSLKDGRTEVADIPCPASAPGKLLIETHRTLVSTGTERMVVEFGKAGWLSKARQQPDKVRMVVDKVRSDGLLPTLEAVRSKLDQPVTLGYSNVGVVADVGPGVHGFQIGDRVASNGPHAEMVSVSANLCARVPEAVSDDEAAFTVVGAIALQGIRLAAPTLGETVVVSGLGLIGLLTVQLLQAQGCRVIGFDFDPARLALARSFGAEAIALGDGADPVAAAEALTEGQGVDAVLITASTDSDEPVRQAARMCRKRGRIVLVGVAGLNLSRADFYEKELTFQVSCSYGPGRYDPVYEDKGVDYPIGFVRWTEQRNFEAVLQLMASGKLDVKPLISHRFPIDDIARAYEVVGGSEPSMGILLDYPAPPKAEDRRMERTVQHAPRAAAPGAVRVAFVGAGNYAAGALIPAFRHAGAALDIVITANGLSGAHVSRKFGFARSSTDLDLALSDPEIQAVVIATRHDSHAQLACRALAAGKHVFVEKPLALNEAGLSQIAIARDEAAAKGSAPVVMVGFNRRFAPMIMRAKALLAQAPGPKAMVMTVNAGAIPATHWTQDAEVGGGRIIGEACHFIDLLRFLVGAPIQSLTSRFMASGTADTASIDIGFEDGSIGTIHYLANGSRAYPKERLQVFAAGRVLEMDNYRSLRGYGWPGFSREKSFRPDKGQRGCAAAFISAIAQGGADPIPFDELIEVGRASIDAARQA